MCLPHHPCTHPTPPWSWQHTSSHLIMPAYPPLSSHPNILQDNRISVRASDQSIGLTPCQTHVPFFPRLFGFLWGWPQTLEKLPVTIIFTGISTVLNLLPDESKQPRRKIIWGIRHHKISLMLFLLEWACVLSLLFVISLLLVLFYCYVCRAEIFIVFAIRISEE